MEQEISKERQPAKCLTDRLRRVAYFVAIVCILFGFVIQFVSLVSMQRRMALFESKLSEISEELLKQARSKTDAKESSSAVHVRHERNANPTTTLADLTKRIIALEGRSTFRGQ